MVKLLIHTDTLIVSTAFCLCLAEETPAVVGYKQGETRKDRDTSVSMKIENAIFDVVSLVVTDKKNVKDVKRRGRTQHAHNNM